MSEQHTEQTASTTEQQTTQATEQTTEQKPAENTTLLTEKVEDAPAAFDPEKITFPEGFQKSPQYDEFTNLAKEAGLSLPVAQKLIDLYSSATKGIYDAWATQNTEWQNTVKSDQEIGGAKLDTVKQTISKMLDNTELSDPKFREALDFTGAGNHPAVIRTLYRWAAKLTEGGSVAGDAPARGRDGNVAETRPSLAGAIYGSEGPRTGGPFR